MSTAQHIAASLAHASPQPTALYERSASKIDAVEREYARVRLNLVDYCSTLGPAPVDAN